MVDEPQEWGVHVSQFFQVQEKSTVDYLTRLLRAMQTVHLTKEDDERLEAVESYVIADAADTGREPNLRAAIICGFVIGSDSVGTAGHARFRPLDEKD